MALIRVGVLVGMGALIGIGALIKKNTFKGGGGAKLNHYGTVDEDFHNN